MKATTHRRLMKQLGVPHDATDDAVAQHLDTLTRDIKRVEVKFEHFVKYQAVRKVCDHDPLDSRFRDATALTLPTHLKIIGSYDELYAQFKDKLPPELWNDETDETEE